MGSKHKFHGCLCFSFLPRSYLLLHVYCILFHIANSRKNYVINPEPDTPALHKLLEHKCWCFLLPPPQTQSQHRCTSHQAFVSRVHLKYRSDFWDAHIYCKVAECELDRKCVRYKQENDCRGLYKTVIHKNNVLGTVTPNVYQRFE